MKLSTFSSEADGDVVWGIMMSAIAFTKSFCSVSKTSSFLPLKTSFWQPFNAVAIAGANRADFSIHDSFSTASRLFIDLYRILYGPLAGIAALQNQFCDALSRWSGCDVLARQYPENIRLFFARKFNFSDSIRGVISGDD